MQLSSIPSKEKVMENGVLFTRIGVSGESTSSAMFRHLHQLPRIWPCGQRRARSGRLGSHGHRAPFLPSVRMAASGLAARETFHWTNNQITHKGLETRKLQNLWFSAFGALTPVFCFLVNCAAVRGAMIPAFSCTAKSTVELGAGSFQTSSLSVTKLSPIQQQQEITQVMRAHRACARIRTQTPLDPRTRTCNCPMKMHCENEKAIPEYSETVRDAHRVWQMHVLERWVRDSNRCES